MQMSEAFAAVIDWALRHDATDIRKLPGLWRGETDQWKVAINGHSEETEGVPPYSMQLEHKTYFQFAVISPNGGAIAGDEADLIDHFKNAQ